MQYQNKIAVISLNINLITASGFLELAFDKDLPGRKQNNSMLQYLVSGQNLYMSANVRLPYIASNQHTEKVRQLKQQNQCGKHNHM